MIGNHHERMSTTALAKYVQEEKDYRFKQINSTMQFNQIKKKVDSCASFELYRENNEFMLSAIMDLSLTNNGEVFITTLENAHKRQFHDIKQQESKYSAAFVAKIITRYSGFVYVLVDSSNKVLFEIRLNIFTAFRRPVSFQLWLHSGEEIYNEKHFKLFGPSEASINNVQNQYITRPPTWNSELQVWQHNLGARVNRACQHNFVVTRYPTDSDVYEGVSTRNHWFDFPISDWQMNRNTSVDKSSHLANSKLRTITVDDSISVPTTPSSLSTMATNESFPTIHSAQRVVIRHGKVSP